jgi:hypothetical protein
MEPKILKCIVSRDTLRKQALNTWADLQGGPGGPWPTPSFVKFFDYPKFLTTETEKAKKGSRRPEIPSPLDLLQAPETARATRDSVGAAEADLPAGERPSIPVPRPLSSPGRRLARRRSISLSADLLLSWPSCSSPGRSPPLLAELLAPCPPPPSALARAGWSWTEISPPSPVYTGSVLDC